jgi:hypothetical protein
MSYEQFVVGALIVVVLSQMLFVGLAIKTKSEIESLIQFADSGVIQDLFMDWWAKSEEHVRSGWEAFADQFGGTIGFEDVKNFTSDWVRWAWVMWSGESTPEDEEWARGQDEDERWAWGWR